VRSTGQERGWCSPIWYPPAADGPKNAAVGMTVADLTSKGATQLTDAELQSLVKGKAFWLRNNVTGDEFSESFTEEGHMTVFHVGESTDMPSGYGKVMTDGYEGTTIPYKIDGGKVVTIVSQDPFATAFYKLGDTYYAPRSNEFGYANYENIPTPQIVTNPLTDLLKQVSTNLGLTEDQKQQVIPILKDEITHLGALKKDTSLTGLKKVERLREIGKSIDEKVSPLLNGDQKAKFQALREQARKKLIETMGSEMLK